VKLILFMVYISHGCLECVFAFTGRFIYVYYYNKNNDKTPSSRPYTSVLGIGEKIHIYIYIYIQSGPECPRQTLDLCAQ